MNKIIMILKVESPKASNMIKDTVSNTLSFIFPTPTTIHNETDSHLTFNIAIKCKTMIDDVVRVLEESGLTVNVLEVQ